MCFDTRSLKPRGVTSVAQPARLEGKGGREQGGLEQSCALGKHCFRGEYPPSFAICRRCILQIVGNLGISRQKIYFFYSINKFGRVPAFPFFHIYIFFFFFLLRDLFGGTLRIGALASVARFLPILSVCLLSVCMFVRLVPMCNVASLRSLRFPPPLLLMACCGERAPLSFYFCSRRIRVLCIYTAACPPGVNEKRSRSREPSAGKAAARTGDKMKWGGGGGKKGKRNTP